MNKPTIIELLRSALACAALGTASAHAGGIMLYEIATPDAGLASAGYAARADDASTLFKNPAGMSLLDGIQIQSGVQALYGSVSFSPDANTSARLGDGGGGNAIGWLPGASIFVVAPLGEKWRLGFGSFSYFGLMQDYEDDWVGRYYARESALIGMSFMPSLSYQATDWLSVGCGLNAMYGMLDTKMAVNNLVGDDGEMQLKDETWGFGANVGVLVRISEQTRFGVSYLSPVELDFEDNPSFTATGPTSRKLDLGITVPQTVMVSVYHELSSRWALMANCGWQDWSEFGYVQAGVENGGTTTVDLEYQDTWHGALGVQYRPSEKYLLSAGAAFDSSAVENQNRTVALPMGQAWRFGLGVQYQLSQAVNIGLGQTFMWAGDMTVDQGDALSARGRVSGSYDNAWFSITSVQLSWSL